MSLAIIHVLCLILAPGPRTLADTTAFPTELDAGYHQMYDLQFDDAHKAFRSWEQLHPEDPLGPSSDAAAYLFSEFDRLGVLQSELFADDAAFQRRQRQKPDPESKRRFEAALATSDHLADSVLARDPHDRNALFAKVLDMGLRADYAALIEKRNLVSLSYTKSAGMLAEKLLAIDPSCYDAYLAVGVENYILGLNPAPVRWLLRAYGAETDRSAGIQKLRLTAEKGHYLLPFARLLLAVAALRDKNRKGAKDILADLAREYPHNQLYARELARLE